MTLAYLFPGQGSQHKGMGEDLFDKYPELVAQANRQLGYSIEKLCLEDKQHLLHQTQYTQPALYTVNVLTYLDSIGKFEIKPNYFAGHSLGEYNALFAAGAFDFLTGLQLVEKRGLLMGKVSSGAMAAVLKLNQTQVQEILDHQSCENVEIANINSVHQCIISGNYQEIYNLEATFVKAGAKYVILNVSAAFHSKYMVDLKQEFASFLKQFELKPLKSVVISNYTARPYPKIDYADRLIEQISNSVRWYESVSWLMQYGVKKFVEIGPGNVLSKLTDAIKDAPYTIESKIAKTANNLETKIFQSESKAEVSIRVGNLAATNQLPARTKLIFMYAGQGSQYYQMGRALYFANRTFRKQMNYCSDYLLPKLGVSLVDIIYDDSCQEENFDNIIFTHPAIFSISYSLTQVLIEQGVYPDGVLGHSLGEYIAATVANVISLEDGLNLVHMQSKLAVEHCHYGGILSILHSAAIFEQRRELFSDVCLAGQNFPGSFSVSGLKEDIKSVKLNLKQEGIFAVEIPINYGFHSQAIDSMEFAFKNYAFDITVNPPSIPLYSSMRMQQMESNLADISINYFWNIARNPANFEKLLYSAFDCPDQYAFIDLSPTATLSTFLKYGFENTFRHDYTINQFGKNVESLNKLLSAFNSY